MNKEVLNIDGKIIVETDKGTKKEVTCSGDLEEILSKENDLETINNKIGDLYSEIDLSKKKLAREKKSNKKSIRELIAINIAMPALTYAICKYGNQPVDFSISTCMILTTSVTVGITSWIGYMSKNEIKKMEDELTSKEVLKEELNNEFVKENSKLRALKKKNNYSVNNEIKTIKLEENKDLKNTLEFYKYIISNYSELRISYENGTLNETLKDYDESKINIAVKYFEDDYNIDNQKKYEESKKLIKK